MPKATFIKIKRFQLGGEELLDIRRVTKNGTETSKGLSLPKDKVQEIAKLMQNEDLDEAIISL